MDSHVAVKMDEGTLVAVLNAAATTGDVELTHLTWDLLQRSLAQPTPMPKPMRQPKPQARQQKPTELPLSPPSHAPEAAAPGAHLHPRPLASKWLAVPTGSAQWQWQCRNATLADKHHRHASPGREGRHAAGAEAAGGAEVAMGAEAAVGAGPAAGQADHHPAAAAEQGHQGAAPALPAAAGICCPSHWSKGGPLSP